MTNKLRIEVYTQTNPLMPQTGEFRSQALKRIDYNNKSDREWLSKHVLWALLNGYQVTTRAY